MDLLKASLCQIHNTVEVVGNVNNNLLTRQMLTASWGEPERGGVDMRPVQLFIALQVH